MYIVARGQPAPNRGVVTDWFRLRAVIFDERNAREMERLLGDLGLLELRPGRFDLADRYELEDQMYRTLARQFVLYAIPRTPVRVESTPRSWFPTSSRPSRPMLSWIGLWLVDQSGQPIAGRPYRLTAPDGQSTAGTLDDQGSVNVKRLAPGSCHVFCPDVQPHGSSTYVVQRGDHISGIALAFGFDDYMIVWRRPENAALRSQRSNAHELVEGDEVFIPALAATPVMKPTAADHVFVLRRSPLKLRIKLLGVAMKPLASSQCRLNGTTLTPGADGVIAVDLDKLTQSTPLTLGSEEFALLPGAMTPHDQEQDDGWIARLYNMGYLLDANAQGGDDELEIALEDFQAEAGLTVTGEIDDATKTALLQVHGDAP